jgi:hypothetical protein
LEGTNQHHGSHGKNHAAIEYLAGEEEPPPKLKPGDACALSEYNKLCAATVEAQFGCKKECIEDQLNASLEGKSTGMVKHVHTKSKAELEPDEKEKILKSAEIKPKEAARNRW